MAELFKFDELRLKTEVQLIRLINSELDRGIYCARLALSSAATKAVAEAWKLRADRACAEASRLIPLALEMSQVERHRAESKLDRLRGMLQSLAGIASNLAPAEDDVAVLASAN